MKAMVDLATTISFVVAPVLAILNTIVIHSEHTPAEARPKAFMSTYAIIGIIFLCLFSFFFLWVRFIK
jgi:hypothetical protein